MSHSYRHQPMICVCGSPNGAHDDKKRAARGVRRAYRRALHTTHDFENFLPPHRLECSWNNNYSWVRDGGQSWQGLDARDRTRQHEALFNTQSVWYGNEEYSVWPPAWYARMMRK